MKKRDKGTPHKSTTPGVTELYFHFNEPAQLGEKGFKAGTVFARQDGDGQPWILSVARCSINDNFCRQVGRSVARRRWFAAAAGPAHRADGIADDYFYAVRGDRPSRAEAYALYSGQG